MKDEYLWNAFRQGDHGAYETIFKEHYKFLLNYGLKFITDREETKDCIQILFANLWHSRERLGANTSIKSYLAASLRRLILRRAKKTGFLASIETIDPAFNTEFSWEAKHIKDEEEKEWIHRLRVAVDQLPNRQKEPLYLKYYNDYAFHEIGEVMGISTRAVYKLMHKALDKLNGQLSPGRNHDARILSLLF